MKNVLGLADKNTGDALGDTSFLLAKKTNAWECRKNPSDPMCTSIAQFKGDDENSVSRVDQACMYIQHHF